MGKISDALEMQEREKSVKAKMLSTKRTENLVKEGPESHLNRELTVQNRVNPKLLAHYASESLDAENFKILKGHILFPKDGRRPKTIMITSAFPGEGKTFVAANLAVSIAQGINEHALLVDCDFRHPDLHNMLGYSNKEGLKEYLDGKNELADLFIQTRIDKLALLTAGGPSANPSELLSSNMVKEFFEEVKERYQDRYIIIDSAPSRIVSEVSILAKYVDGIIFVVMAQKSPREIIEKCIEAIGREKILGIVFNGYSKGEKIYDSYYKNYYKKK
jgi:exopolysaccharide/PEP-CTERM locus tyrosine autokinase